MADLRGIRGTRRVLVSMSFTEPATVIFSVKVLAFVYFDNDGFTVFIEAAKHHRMDGWITSFGRTIYAFPGGSPDILMIFLKLLYFLFILQRTSCVVNLYQGWHPTLSINQRKVKLNVELLDSTLTNTLKSKVIQFNLLINY
ncbi:hypothetical protein HELRODRAFT_158401 [Helobdella robusta]|uniref:Uncharacterized protein n=1 Tax=Helobdella robusta TaxID=6412 RepID=T1EMR5_HELRO|nr:hypothetical protein HELRODRAFT_158401 [Helobdella robusta]ESO12014.1 hypothetical protein HELRODRAFT_158401 [Helobdella robusta]